MAYLTRFGAGREWAATLWLMVLGAGLLATSAPGEPDPASRLWSGAGPTLTLTPSEPVRGYSVSLLVPKPAASGWQAPSDARVSLLVSAMQSSSQGDGMGGLPGAAGAPPDASPPWLTATIRDASGATLVDSTPFLSQWNGEAEVAFSGDCAAPDPAGPNPCKLSFRVEFARSASSSETESQLSWNLDVWAIISGAAPGADLGWTAEIELL